MRKRTKRSSESSRLAPPSRMKGEPMRSSPRNRSTTSAPSRQKGTKTLIFRMRPRFSIGALPKSASSIGPRRKPSPCVWTPTSSPGSRPMVAVTKPRQIGFYVKRCFISARKGAFPAARDTPHVLARASDRNLYKTAKVAAWGVYFGFSILG